MHPFGGVPICPRCGKAVYAAEQTMGPGRKLYHKPCLTCTDCNKRLDSLSLLEHDQEPYCKNCHSKNFGTRDLRQANLPHRDDLAPLSPTRTGISLPSGPTAMPPEPSSPRRYTAEAPTYSRRSTASPPPLPGRRIPQPATVGRADTGNGTINLLRPTRTLSPNRATFGTPSPIYGSFDAVKESEEDALGDTKGVNIDDSVGEEYIPDARNLGLGATPNRPRAESIPTHVGRSQGGLPRTVPLTPDRVGSPTKLESTRSTPPLSYHPVTELPSSTGGANTMALGRAAMVPLATGTRYGAGLMGNVRGNPTGNSPRQWGSGTPQCPKCGKSVYFAEQVKAVGKTYHKACLRCVECNTLLDSSRLTEKDGQPMCHRCYSKFHGPQGSGYALLGKAGG